LESERSSLHVGVESAQFGVFQYVLVIRRKIHLARNSIAYGRFSGSDYAFDRNVKFLMSVRVHEREFT
jgi:hypothetical protein